MMKTFEFGTCGVQVQQALARHGTDLKGVKPHHVVLVVACTGCSDSVSKL